MSEEGADLHGKVVEESRWRRRVCDVFRSEVGGEGRDVDGLGDYGAGWWRGYLGFVGCEVEKGSAV